MPAEKLTQTIADQGAQAMNAAQDNMRRYEQWIDSYQQLLKTSMVGTQMAKVGMHQWQRQMEYLNVLMEASSTVAQATSEYLEKMMTEAMPEWTEATKLTTGRTMEAARDSVNRGMRAV